MEKGWQFWVSWMQAAVLLLFIDSLYIREPIGFRQLHTGIMFAIFNTIIPLYLWWMLRYKAVIEKDRLIILAPLQKSLFLDLKTIKTIRLGEFSTFQKSMLLAGFRKNIMIHTFDSAYPIFTGFAKSRREFTQALIDAVKEANPDVVVSSDLP